MRGEMQTQTVILLVILKGLAAFRAAPPDLSAVTIDPATWLTVQTGENVSLTCKVESNPTANLTWLRGDHILRAVESNTDHFSFTANDCEDSGVYQCRAENVAARKSDVAETRLTVECGPRLGSGSGSSRSEVSGYVGSNVTLSVKVTAEPAPSFRWSGPGLGPRPAPQSPSLTLVSLRPQQAGNYTVTASNKRGSLAHTFVLTVKERQDGAIPLRFKIAIGVAIAVALVCLLVILCILQRKRRRRRLTQRQLHDEENDENQDSDSGTSNPVSLEHVRSTPLAPPSSRASCLVRDPEERKKARTLPLALSRPLPPVPVSACRPLPHVPGKSKGTLDTAGVPARAPPPCMPDPCKRPGSRSSLKAAAAAIFGFSIFPRDSSEGSRSSYISMGGGSLSASLHGKKRASGKNDYSSAAACVPPPSGRRAKTHRPHQNARDLAPKRGTRGGESGPTAQVYDSPPKRPRSLTRGESLRSLPATTTKSGPTARVHDSPPKRSRSLTRGESLRSSPATTATTAPDKTSSSKAHPAWPGYPTLPPTKTTATEDPANSSAGTYLHPRAEWFRGSSKETSRKKGEERPKAKKPSDLSPKSRKSKAAAGAGSKQRRQRKQSNSRDALLDGPTQEKSKQSAVDERATRRAVVTGWREVTWHRYSSDSSITADHRSLQAAKLRRNCRRKRSRDETQEEQRRSTNDLSPEQASSLPTSGDTRAKDSGPTVVE